MPEAAMLCLRGCVLWRDDMGDIHYGRGCNALSMLWCTKKDKKGGSALHLL